MEKNTEITTEMMNEIMDKAYEEAIDKLKNNKELRQSVMRNLEERCGLKKIGDMEAFDSIQAKYGILPYEALDALGAY